jgi:hypothetical protein
MSQQFYKIWTHDFRSPLQGGEQLWDGSVPFELPKVKLDTSDAECGAGWNFVESIEQGFQIAGMWPTGRPSVASIVEANGDAIQRGNKWRSSNLKVVGLATEVQVAQAIERFSQVFKGFESEMANEQIAWRHALGRPENNKAAVVEALEKALSHRGLKWELKEYGDAWDARDARNARAVWAARAAWDARDARAAWDAWDVWAAWDAWDARDARDARAARDAWAARAARAALIVFFASKKGWIKEPADLLTLGLREAYANGLEIALPTGKDELGWSMKP